MKKAGKVRISLLHRVEMTAQDLVEALSLDMTDDDLFVVLASIDEAVCDWAFTERCFAHFKDLMEQKAIEDKEDDPWPKSRLHS